MASEIGYTLGFLFLLFAAFWIFKKSRKICLIVDGDVKNESLEARDFLKKYANFNGDAKNLNEYQSLLNAGLLKQKTIIFCKIGARVELIQETAILKLAEELHDKILIFYIKPSTRPEFKISECKARQINLDTDNIDVKVMTDTLAAFLKVRPFERLIDLPAFLNERSSECFKNSIILMMLLILASAIMLWVSPLSVNYNWLELCQNLSLLSPSQTVQAAEPLHEALLTKFPEISDIDNVEYLELMIQQSKNQLLQDKQMIYNLSQKVQSLEFEKTENSKLIYKLSQKILNLELENIENKQEIKYLKSEGHQSRNETNFLRSENYELRDENREMRKKLDSLKEQVDEYGNILAEIQNQMPKKYQ